MKSAGPVPTKVETVSLGPRSAPNAPAAMQPIVVADVHEVVMHAESSIVAEGVKLYPDPKFRPDMVTDAPIDAPRFREWPLVTIGESYENTATRVPTTVLTVRIVDSFIAVAAAAAAGVEQ